MDKAALELKLDLMLLEVDPKADQKELIKLPPWIKEIVKKGGIPVTENVTITPDVDFDLKSKKLKKFGITFKWEF